MNDILKVRMSELKDDLFENEKNRDTESVTMRRSLPMIS